MPLYNPSSSLTSTAEAIIGAFFSDGSDGDATLDGTNTVNWATKSGSTYTATRVPFLGNLITALTIILNMNNFHGPYGTGTLTNNGTIHNDGNAAIAAAGGTGKAAGTMTATAAGGAGQIGAGSGGGVSGGAPNPIASKYTGGTGGAGGGGAGGGGGAVTAQAATRGNLRGGAPLLGGLNLSQLGAACPTAGSGGGGGGGSGAAPGGGGGGGGGQLHIGFGRVVNNGIIGSRGGAGAAGTVNNSGGGAGGGGGFVEVVAGSYSGNDPDVTGGAGGASGGGTGGVGNTGLSGDFVKRFPVALAA